MTHTRSRKNPFIHLSQLHRKIKGFMSQLVALSTWVMKVEESTGCFLTQMAKFQHLLLLMWYNHIQLNSESMFGPPSLLSDCFMPSLIYSTVQFHNAINCKSIRPSVERYVHFNLYCVSYHVKVAFGFGKGYWLLLWRNWQPSHGNRHGQRSLW